MRAELRRRSVTRSLAIALSGVLIAGLAVIAGTSMATAASGGMTMSGSSSARVGTTKGWFAGHTVNLTYTKNFFCRRPPSSKSVSKCEVGANYSHIPNRNFDPLYVVVPIGFTPRKSSLQCPAGNCVDHPHRIDLSRVLGKGTGNTLLPAHSHVVTTAAGFQSEWWNVDVVGVTNRRTWNSIVSHKNYHIIQRMRSHGNPHVTENLTSNLFLYFRVDK